LAGGGLSRKYIFYFNRCYILVEGRFGSCSACDFWLGLYESRYSKDKMISDANEYLEGIFKSIKVYESLDKINFGDPDMKEKFEKFKYNHLKNE
jgi:hypothetical protein